MVNITKFANFFLILLIISLSISPAFLLGEGNRNLLLIAVMFLSPALIFIFNKYSNTDIWVVAFLLCIVLIPISIRPQNMRWSTVLYSCMFGLTFMAYTRLLSFSSLTKKKYIKVLKILIYAFSITLIIQQFCVFNGLPIFNVSNYNPGNPWKLNSLSLEPSYTARIVSLLMFSIIMCKESILQRKYDIKIDFKRDKWLWLSFLWVILTINSGTSFLFLPIILLKCFRFKNSISFVLLLLIIFALLTLTQVTAFERTFEVMKATIIFDTDRIIEADHSASLRIVPSIVIASMLDLSSLNGWFGNGIDYVSSFLYLVVPGIPEGTSGGGLLALWLEYGFVCFLLFFILSLKVVKDRNNYFNLIFWFLMIFLYNINNQIVWLCLTLLWTNKHFAKTNIYK